MKYSLFAAGLASLCLAGMAAAQNAAPEVSAAVQHDVSQPLRAMSRPPLAGPKHEKPLLRLNGPSSNQSDPVVQTSAGPLVATNPGLNFAGVGNGDYGFSPNAAPPDTNGAVGATQYVQWVNESFAVFDKNTGALVQGPVAGNSLWSGFGGGCQTNNDGDPVVQYDKAANRWVFTQFSVSTTPYLQCVAVSTTSDATGTYNRYAFSEPNFPDYPKLGVWRDGYYISFNMFNGNSFVGGRACAFDRNKMLAGTAATQICFQLSNIYGGLLPSDLDGSTAPPAGSPNFFLAFGSNALQLWKFHTDFTTPANSTFTGPTIIPVAAFSEACGGGTCIPQSGTTQKLDSLADRLMYRLAYRNFGDHEAMVANHSVTAGSSVGVRWYELRNPNGTPTVFQQGTYAPDSNYRWMGSIAMDKAGDIAVGYSVSSSSINPAIRYTGRVPGDALGTLQAENTITVGTGSQTSGLSRWGDYSAMTIDPADDCTFWYTNEYLKTTGSFNWSTRIGTFKFPSCGSTIPDVAITQVNVPSPVVVNSPNSVVVTVKNVGGAVADSFTVTLGDSLAATITTSPQIVTNLAAGASQNLTFSWTPTTTGSHTLTATAGTPTGETNTANNTLTAGSTVTVPDLAITQVNVPSPVGVNTPNSVVVTVKNVGSAVANSSSVSLGDSLAATITSSPQTVTSLAAGASVNLTFGWTPTETGTHSLTATASGASGETNTANNSLSANSTVSTAPPPPADFTISASPGLQTVGRPSKTSYTVTVSAVNSFSGVVNFSVSGLPSKVSASFSPSSVTGSGNSTMSLNVNPNSSPGTYTLTITGTSGSLSHSTQVTLIIQ